MCINKITLDDMVLYSIYSYQSHHETHRSSALATLQFNCHLGFVVILVLGGYSAIAGNLLKGDGRSRYKALDVIESSSDMPEES